MLNPRKYRPITSRISSGLIAGLIVGILVGTAIAIRLIQTNQSLHSALLQGQLRLHMAAIYACLMAIIGVVIGALAVGRRREVGLVAHGILILLAIAVFYYGRNWLSIHLFAHFAGLRWVVEIAGAILWAAACWIGYRILLYMEGRTRGWTVRIALILALVAIAWSAYPVMKSFSSYPVPAAQPALPAPKEDVKVALIGIDGAWWEIIDPLMDSGRMPTMKSLVDRGIRSQCHTILPTFSPPIWNTIATGKMPEKHHMTSFRVWTFPITGVVLPITKIPGSFHELQWMMGRIIQITPINSTFRTTEALWNILSDVGLTVGVLNWWGSYPAEPVNGYMVSDHALYNKAMEHMGSQVVFGDSLSVFPSRIISELEPLIVEPEDIPIDDVARFIHLETEQDRTWYRNTKDYQVFDEDSKAAMFKFSYPEDITMVRAALYMLKQYGQPDFFTVYLDGTDSMEHFYLPYFFHERHTDRLDPDNIRRFKDLVPEYYVYIDEVLEQILGALDPNTIVIVVSDHGFDHGIHPEGSYEHQNAPPGVFVMAGGDTKQGKTITTAGVKDITPTILNLFGLPVGRDMDGRVLTEAFDLKNVPVNFIETYDYKNRQPGRAVSVESNQAYQERLRALGYFK